MSAFQKFNIQMDQANIDLINTIIENAGCWREQSGLELGTYEVLFVDRAFRPHFERIITSPYFKPKCLEKDDEYFYLVEGVPYYSDDNGSHGPPSLSDITLVRTKDKAVAETILMSCRYIDFTVEEIRRDFRNLYQTMDKHHDKIKDLSDKLISSWSAKLIFERMKQ